MKILLIVPLLLVVTQIKTALAGQNLGDMTAYPISELTSQAEGQPTLIGGRPSNPAHFPVNYYSQSAGGSCTSTLVSSDTLFTAAHCVGDGKAVTIKTLSNTYSGTCTHAPEYASNHTADYALCKMTNNIPVGSYERVNIDSNLLKEGVELLLTGFGCTRPGGTGGNDGVYRIGEAKIQVLPAGNNNDIVTKGEVALCYGDSGGPAYLLLEGKVNGPRLQVSINSRGNIYTTSYLSSLSTQMAIAFMKSWSASNDAKICGLHADASNCRN